MPKHLAFFLFALSFLAGIAYLSLGLPLLFIFVPTAFLFATLFSFGTRVWLAAMAALLLLAGGYYYAQDDSRYQSVVAKLPQSASIKGLVVSDPKREIDYQSFYLKTNLGKISITAAPEPQYFYGDSIVAEGKLEKPQQNSYGNFLAKENVVGSLWNPQLTLVATGQGNKFLAFLLHAKQQVRISFQKYLSPQKAAFLFGVIMGSNENFSPQFAQNLSTSGLRFLTAIDGLHMTIVIFIVFGVLAYFLPRRYAFLATFVFILIFLALTGFSVSGIRAASLAFAAGIAREAGRQYTPRNVILLVAVILVLFTPKVLLFDLGFQLSFLAVLSIIYFKPALGSFLHFGDSPGFLGLKDSLLVTLSVQLATAPILITQFQNFSLTSFLASVLVVIILPYLIAGGLLLSASAFIFTPLAKLLSFFVNPLVSYVMIIINLSARWAVPFNPSLSFISIILYYGVLISLMLWHYREKVADEEFEAMNV